MLPTETDADRSHFPSTELDAEKRLALQEEKQALEAKLLEVYVRFTWPMATVVTNGLIPLTTVTT